MKIFKTLKQVLILFISIIYFIEGFFNAKATHKYSNLHQNFLKSKKIKNNFRSFDKIIKSIQKILNLIHLVISTISKKSTNFLDHLHF